MIIPSETALVRGKLKIFLGAVPGVGKTCTMLEAAHNLKNTGVDVIIGLLETHGRKETERLKIGLEELPRAKRVYRGRPFEEMDTDEIIKRYPNIVLIDELAHTNVPGSRHEKRYMDIEEILCAGIDVYSTLNIQHIESLHEDIKEITGLNVKETVPDKVVLTADVIELVDLHSMDVIKRLREGKIYIPQQVELASERFFTEHVLVSLRELALRYTAKRIEKDLSVLTVKFNKVENYNIYQEKILVCINEKKECEDLVRIASQMASMRKGTSLAALYVDTEDSDSLTIDQKNSLSYNMNLVKKLAGEVYTIQGTDLVEDVMNFAKNMEFGEIIVGKQLKGGRLGRSLGGTLAKKSNFIVHVIPLGKGIKSKKKINFSTLIDRVFISSLVIGIGHGIVIGLTYYVQSTQVVSIYSLLSLIVAIFAGGNAALLASLIFMILHDLTFFDGVGDVFSLDGFVVFFVFMSTGYLLRKYVPYGLRKKVSFYSVAISQVYSFFRNLKHIKSKTEVLTYLTENVEKITNMSAYVYQLSNKHIHCVSKKHDDYQFSKSDKEAIEWSVEYERKSGIGTETFSEIPFLVIPFGMSSRLALVLYGQNEYFEGLEQKLVEILIYQTMTVFDTLPLEWEKVDGR